MAPLGLGDRAASSKGAGETGAFASCSSVGARARVRVGDSGEQAGM